MLVSRGPQCLVIDADPQSLAESLAAFRAADLVAQGAHSASSAIASCRVMDFDLVLCDVDVAGMCGRAIAAQIRQIPWQTHIPILYSSAYQQAEVISRQGADGLQFQLRRPVNPQLVLDLADQHRVWTAARYQDVPRPRPAVSCEAFAVAEPAPSWVPTPHLPAFRQVLAEMLIGTPLH